GRRIYSGVRTKREAPLPTTRSGGVPSPGPPPPNRPRRRPTTRYCRYPQASSTRPAGTTVSRSPCRTNSNATTSKGQRTNVCTGVRVSQRRSERLMVPRSTPPCEAQARLKARARLTIDHVRRRGCDRLRRLIDLLHDLLHRFAGNRIDLQFHFLGFGEEARILHGIHERLAQSGRAVRGNARRRQKGTSHRLAGKYQLEDLPLLVGL